MNEWLENMKEITYPMFKEYGKLFFLVGAVLLSLLVTLQVVRMTKPPVLEVSFLDIGQGDAIYIRTPSGHDMLIDGGPTDTVLEKLSGVMSYFDTHLDMVVATHPDADHITGLIPVLKHYDVDHIISSPVMGHTGVFDELQKSIKDEGATVHVGAKGDVIDFGDGVHVKILYPYKSFFGNEKDTNDASVSLVLTYGDESVLLTGDLPSTHEDDLVSDLLPHNVTVYKAGHHGSKYSSGDILLSYIRPEYSIISAGKDNKYGHPNPEALRRLESYSREVLSTIDYGTLHFYLDGSTVRFMTTR